MHLTKFFLIYSIKKNDDIMINAYGISQTPDTKNYIMVLYYAEGGSFNNWMKNSMIWYNDVGALGWIIRGLGKNS